MITKEQLKKIIPVILCVIFINSIAHAADVEKALFGWTASNGVHISGTLANEGVTAKNPRGFQQLKSDPGNYRNGKFCGGTAFGIACGPNPQVNILKINRANAIRFYHDNQWAAIHGDEIESQYLAYKLFDLAVNMGSGTAVILLIKTVNDINGKYGDLSPNEKLTPEIIAWINAFTAPQQLKYGGVSNWRRWCFFAQLKINALSRYGNLIAKNQKLAQFWEVWDRRAKYDS